MEVILRIPKMKTVIEKVEKSKSRCNEIEIINSAEFNRANIRFQKAPPDAVKQLLLAEGWTYSVRKKIWYPKGRGAAENSYDFAMLIKSEFFGE